MSNQPDRVNLALERAVQKAQAMSHEYVTLEHLLYSIIEEKDVLDFLGKMHVDIASVVIELEEYLRDREDIFVHGLSQEPRKTLHIDRVFNRAVTQVIFSGRTKLHCQDILISMLSETASHAYYILRKNGASRDLAVSIIQKEFYAQMPDPQNGQVPGQQGQGAPVKFEDFCENLNKSAAEGKIDPVIGRSEEIIELTEVLARRKKNNVIIVGEPVWVKQLLQKVLH